MTDEKKLEEGRWRKLRAWLQDKTRYLSAANEVLSSIADARAIPTPNSDRGVEIVIEHGDEVEHE